MNWDDLRIILAVCDGGSYAAASERLRIDGTTVARRLDRLQKSLGVILFDTIDGTRRPTAHCEAILAHIQDIERRVSAIGSVGTKVPGVSGRIRIASTNAIAEEILAPKAASFLARHPGLTVQFLTSNENANMSRWQADIAIRLKKPEKGEFTISKLAEFRLYLFQPANQDLMTAYPSALDLTPESQALAARGFMPDVRCVTDNVRIVRELIRSRACGGILPDYLCRDLLDDPHLSATLLPERREVWLLVQQHMKANPAARLTIDWLRSCFKAIAAGGR